MNKQKIICLVTLAMSTMFLTACTATMDSVREIGVGLKEWYEVSQKEAEMMEDIDDFLGFWEGNVYTNKSFDLQYNLGEDWEYLDDDMLRLANSMSGVNLKSMSNESVGNALANEELVAITYAGTYDGTRGTSVSLMEKPLLYNLFSIEEILVAGVEEGQKEADGEAYTMIDVTFMGESSSAVYMPSDEEDDFKHTIAVIIEKSNYYVIIYCYSDTSLSDATLILDSYSEYSE